MDETLFDEERLVEELIRGRDSTEKLRDLLRQKADGDGSGSVDDLVMEILGSFSGGLSVLGSDCSGEAPASGYVVSDCSGEGGCEGDGGGDGKKPAPTEKERRGCYKRRKTSESSIKVADTIEDGYEWRKYGQKEILNAKFPRCYFRCTHKSTRGCKALKQVQKMEDGSEMFHITYFSHHTCHNMHKNTHVFSDSGILNSFLLNVEHSKNHPSVITNTHVTPLVKQEDDSKAHSEDLSDNVSSINYGQPSFGLWNDIFCNSGSSHKAPPTMGFDHEDSCASNKTHGYLDTDIFRNDGSMSDDQFDEIVFS